MTIFGFSNVESVAAGNRDNTRELFQGCFQVLSYLGMGFISFPLCNGNNAKDYPELD